MNTTSQSIILPYTANSHDLEILARAVGVARSGELSEILPPHGLHNTDIILFDSSNLYIFSLGEYRLRQVDDCPLAGYKMYVIEHKRNLCPDDFRMITSLALQDDIDEIVFSASDESRWQPIFAPPVSLFTQLNRRTRQEYSLYSYDDGYVYTVVNHFAHIAYCLHGRSSQFNHDQSYRAIRESKLTLSGAPQQAASFQPPGHPSIEYVFALLVEYEAARLTGSAHHQRLRSDILATLEDLQRQEEHHILRYTAETLLTYPSAFAQHRDFAKVALSLILRDHPGNWSAWLLTL